MYTDKTHIGLCLNFLLGLDVSPVEINDAIVKATNKSRVPVKIRDLIIVKISSNRYQIIFNHK